MPGARDAAGKARRTQAGARRRDGGGREDAARDARDAGVVVAMRVCFGAADLARAACVCRAWREAVNGDGGGMWQAALARERPATAAALAEATANVTGGHNAGAGAGRKRRRAPPPPTQDGLSARVARNMHRGFIDGVPQAPSPSSNSTPLGAEPTMRVDDLFLVVELWQDAKDPRLGRMRIAELATTQLAQLLGNGTAPAPPSEGAGAGNLGVASDDDGSDGDAGDGTEDRHRPSHHGAAAAEPRPTYDGSQPDPDGLSFKLNRREAGVSPVAMSDAAWRRGGLRLLARNPLYAPDTPNADPVSTSDGPSRIQPTRHPPQPYPLGRERVRNAIANLNLPQMSDEDLNDSDASDDIGSGRDAGVAMPPSPVSTGTPPPRMDDFENEHTPSDTSPLDLTENYRMRWNVRTSSERALYSMASPVDYALSQMLAVDSENQLSLVAHLVNRSTGRSALIMDATVNEVCPSFEWVSTSRPNGEPLDSDDDDDDPSANPNLGFALQSVGECEVDFVSDLFPAPGTNAASTVGWALLGMRNWQGVSFWVTMHVQCDDSASPADDEASMRGGGSGASGGTEGDSGQHAVSKTLCMDDDNRAENGASVSDKGPDLTAGWLKRLSKYWSDASHAEGDGDDARQTREDIAAFARSEIIPFYVERLQARFVHGNADETLPTEVFVNSRDLLLYLESLDWKE